VAGKWLKLSFGGSSLTPIPLGQNHGVSAVRRRPSRLILSAAKITCESQPRWLGFTEVWLETRVGVSDRTACPCSRPQRTGWQLAPFQHFHEADAVEFLRRFDAASFQQGLRQSVMLTGTSDVRPAVTWPGQRTIKGTRKPPSYRKPLPARYGVLCVEGLSGDSSTCSPPLSETKTTRVRSARRRSSSLSRTCPTQVSSVFTMAP